MINQTIIPQNKLYKQICYKKNFLVGTMTKS